MTHSHTTPQEDKAIYGPQTTAAPVTIEKLVSGGYGLCRTPHVQLVPLAVPGDQGHIHISGKKVVAEWVTLQQPSAARMDAACSQFGVCGGCQWQMLPLPLQHFWKQTMLAENFTRIGKLPPPYPIQPVLAAGSYHSRATLKCQVLPNNTQNAPLQLRLVGHNPMHRVHPEPCWLVPDAIQQVMHRIEQHPWTGTVRPALLTLRQDDTGIHVLLTLEKTRGITPWCEALMADSDSHIRGIHTVSQDNPTHYKTQWGNKVETHQFGGQPYQVAPTSFFQVNPTGAEALLATIKRLAGVGNSLLDGYSGVGVFSVALAGQFNQITAVEGNPTAHNDALVNTAGYAHITCINQPMERFVHQADAPDVDVAIVDPPRAGLDAQVTRWLAEHVQQAIILVGCDMAAVARDTSRLLQAGWLVAHIQPIDMFPHTHHLETVVHLTRESSSLYQVSA
jgi:23S rRNA (uracil1939-C5)-methyltransferase